MKTLSEEIAGAVSKSPMDYVLEERTRIHDALMAEIRSLVVYVEWSTDEKRGRPVDAPYVVAEDLIAVVNRVCSSTTEAEAEVDG